MADIGIIGGADGPTAVFIAGELPMVRILGIAAIVAVIAIAVIVTLVTVLKNKD